MPTRNQLYALVHMGAARLGYKAPEDYRAWLQSLTGKQSATECTLLELNGLVSTLRACNALESPKIQGIKGGRGQGERPTGAQWRTANGLCRSLGMSGCCDARFTAFAKRTAHVDHPRFLTLRTMQAVISGLLVWVDQVKKKERT